MMTQMGTGQLVLAATILVPLVGGILLSLIPRSFSGHARGYALGISGLVLVMAGWLWANFDPTVAGMQFEIDVPWIAGLGTAFHLGVDGLSLPLLFLTALLTCLAVIASAGINDRERQYFTLLLLLEAGLSGVFVSLDLILFYLFWEVVLIPMYFLISIWGGPNRAYAAVKFFLYTLAGSLAMLAGIIALYLATGAKTFDLIRIAESAGHLPAALQTGIFIAIAVGLAVKVPIFPLHTWLPDAHVEAPTAVSVLLAGVLLKMGSYGFIRLGPGVLPAGFTAIAPVLAVLAVISIVYGAALALVQTDLKRLVAYSSVSHMGYVMLGISAGTTAGLTGATVQMFSHGLIAGLLFLLVGAVYSRAHTREMAAFGGIAKVTPILAGGFVFASFASLGLPGMSGFIGEFLVVAGTLPVYPVLAMISAAAVVLTVSYLLWMLRRVTFGPLNEERAGMPDISGSEVASMAPLALLILVVGVLPQSLIGVMQTTIESIVAVLAR
ncbi:MAG: NADH-quinone oxidoreductase subunit M [Coriobacteriia bacterium]|nr:NADH-quinone oxidoreductase subunit M [Coriobacteriia bacterium]